MDFDQWWQDHGRHNAAAKGIADQYVRDLMRLAFEVGREGKREAVAAERERCAKVAEGAQQLPNAGDDFANGWCSAALQIAQAIRRA